MTNAQSGPRHESIFGHRWGAGRSDGYALCELCGARENTTVSATRCPGIRPTAHEPRRDEDTSFTTGFLTSSIMPSDTERQAEPDFTPGGGHYGGGGASGSYDSGSSDSGSSSSSDSGSSDSGGSSSSC